MEKKQPGRRPVNRGGTATVPLGKRPVQARQAAPVRQKPPQPKPKRPDHEIVYTPPKPFNRNRLLMQLGIVAAVVLAVFLSLWLFFKVGTVTVANLGSVGENGISVTGSGRYSVQTIVEASGIKPGDSLLAINKANVSSQIITKLPYVKSVRIGIKLPGTVNIEIEELDVVYSVSEMDGTWWLMTSDGKLVEKTDAAKASEHTRILGVYLDMPVAGQQAVAREQEPETTEGEDTTDPAPIVTITNEQRLLTAKTIVQYLEAEDVMGEVVSVDVTDMGMIRLMYGQQFDILLGDSMDLKYKIEMALAAVEQLADYDRGSLDVSFLARNEVVYTPQTD